MEDHWTWISSYLDGELTEEQQQHLERWLEEDTSHQKLFALQCFAIHSQLQDSFNESRIQELLLKRLSELVAHPHGSIAGEDWTSEDLSSLLLEAGIPQKDRANCRVTSARPFYARLPGLAAAMLVCATIALVLHFWTRSDVIAQVTRCVNCQWGGKQTQIIGGTFLHENQELELVEGKSRIKFGSGAELYVEGPAKLRLDDPLSCELYAGHISAYVPAEATGFTVESGNVKVVDRGTEFTMKSVESESIELHVHVGFVDVQVPRPVSGETQPLRMVEERAMNFNCRSGEVRFIPHDNSLWVSIPDKL